MNKNENINNIFDNLNKGKNKLIHNLNAYNDLQIEDKIFDSINMTITKFGAEKLKNRLSYTMYNYDDLKRMTDKNMMIHNDQNYIDKMTKYLTQIKEVESNIYDWMIEECEKDLIFSSNYFNMLNNRVFLTISNKLKFSSILLVIFFYLFIYLLMQYLEMPISIYDYAKSIVIGYKYFTQFVLYYFMSDDDWIENLAIILITIYLGYQCYMFYQAVVGCYNHYQLCNEFYKSYNKVIKFTEYVQKIYDHDTYIKTDINNNSIIESIEYLRYYFDHNSSLGFSLISKISIDDYMRHINTLSNYVGKIDYTINIVKLLDKSYTIPHFIKSDFPIIKINDMWNPMIPENKRVKNSIRMDQSTSNLMIITGPNKAGKSTFMRTVLLNVYLSHSIGISCCGLLELTPFRDLYTYLNVPDCIGRESLFEAELNRCYEYIQKIENFRGFSLGLIDELFTGTNPKEGMAGSYAIIKKLTELPINITIMSTHFHDILDTLVSTNAEYNPIFMKFIAYKDHNDKYQFDYLIKDGISNQCIALELLKEQGFDKDIIDNAYYYLNNKTK